METNPSEDPIELQSSLQNNNKKAIMERFKQFLEKFIKYFMKGVKDWEEEAIGDKPKSSKTAIIAGQVMGSLPVIGAKIVGKNLIKTVGNEEHKAKTKKRLKFLCDRSLNLINVAFRVSSDIFQSFEYQFTEISDKGGWKIAMEELARDAVERIMNGIEDYVNQYPSTTEDCLSDILLKCFLQGKSKQVYGKIKPLRNILYKNVHCYVSSLYEKVGIFDKKKDKYFIKKDGSSEPKKYGYRLIFEHEKTNSSQTILKEEITSSIQHYTYLISSNDITKMKDSLKDDLLPEKEELKAIKKVVNQINDKLDNNANVSSHKHIWFELRSPCVHFTGRQKFLEKLCEEILRGILVVTGLSGVGKSELATQFGHFKYSEEYNVIWINAETHETATGSFRRLYKKLGFKMKDIDGEDKTLNIIIEDTFDHFSTTNTLFILDNADNYKSIEGLLPLTLPSTVKQPKIVITSTNGEWRSDRCTLIILKLDDFEDEEAQKFIRSYLGIEHDNNSAHNIIKNLTGKLHNFPLALQHVATFIKNQNEILKNVDSDRSIIDYLSSFDVNNQTHLKSRVFQDNDNTNGKTIFTILQLVVDKIKNNKDVGESALLILNILAYFSSDGTPVKTFSVFFEYEYELAHAIHLLKIYSVVRSQKDTKQVPDKNTEMLHVHGLLKEVIRLNHDENTGDSLHRESILDNSLQLLKEYCDNRDYTSHIISVWNYAYKYDKLIEKFIVNEVQKNKTNFFHLISGFSKYDIFQQIINCIEINHSQQLNKIVNSRDTNRGSALHRAAAKGDEKIVKILIEKDARVNLKKKHGWTPLHLASQTGNLEVIELLLPESNISATTGYKFTCLHLAARSGHHNIVSTLLQHQDVDVNSKTKEKFTALHFAVQIKHIEIVRLLLNHDQINVNAKTLHQATPLHFASKLGCLDIVKALIEKGALCEAKNEDGFTPLHYASMENHTDVVKALLGKTEDLNLQTTEGNTALHFAAEKDNIEIVKALLDNEVKVDIINGNGKTAVDLALENNHLDIVKYISEHNQKTTEG